MANGIDASEEKRCAALECIDDARELNSRGERDAAHAEIQRAWQLLDEALVLCPQNHKARFLLVSCAMNAEDFPRARLEALRIYEQMTEQQKLSLGDSVLHLSIAHASKMLGDNREAIEFAEEATRLYVDDPQPFLILGELLEAQGDVERAEQCCRKALSFNDDPDCRNPLTHHNLVFALCCLGCCLMKQGCYTDAESVLLKGYHIDQSALPALRHLADVYIVQDRLEDALDMAQCAQRYEPEDRELEGKVLQIRRALAVKNKGPPQNDPLEMENQRPTWDPQRNHGQQAKSSCPQRVYNASVPLSPHPHPHLAPPASRNTADVTLASSFETGSDFTYQSSEPVYLHSPEFAQKAPAQKNNKYEDEEESANDSFWFCCMDRSGPSR